MRRWLRVATAAMFLVGRPAVAKRKKEAIDESILPSLRSLLESAGLGKEVVSALEGRGYERTRQVLKWGRSDVQLLGAELNFTQEVGLALLAQIEALRAVAVKAEATEIGDLDAELKKERAALAYGRLYVSRSTASFDYKRAWFGAPPPLGSLELRWAHRNDGCEPDAGLSRGAAVVVDRGGCSFVDKAWNFANASALIVVNGRDMPFDRPASGHASDEVMTQTPKTLCVVLADAAARPALARQWDEELDARLVPLKCSAGQPECMPLLRDENDATHVDSGYLIVDGSRHEFVAAVWGGLLPVRPRQLAVARPTNLCAGPPSLLCRFVGLFCAAPRAREFMLAARDAVVLADRGGCDFGAKVDHAAALGAAALVVAQVDDEPLLRMGSRGFPPGLPAVLVDRAAGVSLREATAANVSFVPAAPNFAQRWLDLASVEWPGDATAADLLLERLEYEHRDSPTRLAWLRRAHTNRMQQAACASDLATGG